MLTPSTLRPRSLIWLKGLPSSHCSPRCTASSTSFLCKFKALWSTTMETPFSQACRNAARAAAPGGPSVSSGGSWLRCAGKPVVRSTERVWDGDRKARSSLPGRSRCPRPRLPKIRQKQN